MINYLIKICQLWIFNNADNWISLQLNNRILYNIKELKTRKKIKCAHLSGKGKGKDPYFPKMSRLNFILIKWWN